MKKIKISQRAKHAILIGGLCSVSYLAVYIARNMLGAAAPKMDGFTTSDIANLGSAFFLSYGTGQLINGFIGDKIKARYMISFGLLFAGLTSILFVILSDNKMAAMLSYVGTGFFLAMIYGPMTKVVSENTDPIHATRCSLGYTFASFLGSPAAGVLATIFSWKNTFIAGSVALIAMAIIVFAAFILLEKKGIVKYGQYKHEKKKGNGLIKLLFTRYNFLKFAVIAILTGVIRTSVVQLITLYFQDYLNFSENDAPLVYSGATVVMAMTTFITIFIYERLKRNMNLTILLMFISSTLCFCGVYFVKQPVVNIIFIILAIMSSNGAATMLWSRYCPSLYETGMVSSITGFLDFLSYMSAAIANVVFGMAIDGFKIFGREFNGIGWRNLILVWMGTVALGIIIALPYGKIFKRNKNKVTEIVQ